MSEPWHWHGGGLAAARAHFGEGEAPWLDLSTGINPHAWPRVDKLPIDWHRLPEEAELRALEAAAAQHFGTDPRHVCAVPGTEIGLRLIGTMLPAPAHYLAPSYRTHGEMFGGAQPVAVENVEQTEGDVLILASPNNPDARRPDLLRLIDRAGWLLVDEAFADARPQESLAGLVSDDRLLIVFRSFGKFFGLAGVRLGFVLGPVRLIADLRKHLGAWPVSAAAITIGTAAYSDRAWITAMRAGLDREAAALDAVLRSNGHDPIGDCPLFRLIDTPDASVLFERLARRSILTRPFDYNPRWLRLGLPDCPEALDRLNAALRDG